MACEPNSQNSHHYQKSELLPYRGNDGNFPFRRMMYGGGGGSEAAAAGLHLSMGSLIEEQQRAPQMVSNTASVPRLSI